VPGFDWYDKAACKGLDVEIFFAETPGQSAEALRVCASCPVRAECHDAAMTEREYHGVWGGTPENARRRVFRREDRLRRRSTRAA
jgi:WhiB family transcriptional regulator, redox-sensing transcriptional regulator